MAKTPKGIAANKIIVATVFLMISKRKNKSERPLTCKRLKLMVLIWLNITAKQNNCKKMMESAHLSVRSNNMVGLLKAARSILKNIRNIEVILIYFLYTSNNWD